MLRAFHSATELGAGCRQARRKLGLRLEEAALAAGVNYRFASEIENGKPSAQIDLALRYATTLGITLFYSLHDTDDDSETISSATQP